MGYPGSHDVEPKVLFKMAESCTCATRHYETVAGVSYGGVSVGDADDACRRWSGAG